MAARGLVLMIFAAFLSACSPLRTFNSLVPKDAGGQVVLRGASFGPHERQRLDLYRPKGAGATGEKLPIILFLYGGSWNSGVREGYGFAGRALAARGFLVAVPDYRVVPEVRFPTFLEDNAAALRWLRANAGRHGGDADRIVIVGHSAGAYNGAMLALEERWLGEDRKAVRAFVGLAGPYDFLPLSGPVTKAAFEHVVDPGTTQPVAFASAGDPPTLLLHGADDTTVYPRNSRALAERLRAVGVAAEVKVYPKLGHVGILTALARPFRGKAPVLEDIAAFATEATQKR